MFLYVKNNINSGINSQKKARMTFSGVKMTFLKFNSITLVDTKIGGILYVNMNIKRSELKKIIKKEKNC